MYCAPRKNKKKETCYDSNDIIALAKAYNKYIKKSNLCKGTTCALKKEIVINGKTSKELHTELNNRLNKISKQEYSWIELDFINEITDKNLKEKLLNYTFKPKSPKGKYSWLNTTNIEQVLHQYEELYDTKNFKFIGAQPADYSLFQKINYNSLFKVKKIGIVFNTDKHDKPGQHWVCTFIDNKKKSIEYFDSLGNKPNKYILDFFNHFKNYSFIYNKIEFQKGQSNCGIYAINFILLKLKNYSFNEIISMNLTDKIMTDYRQELFRP
jgi:hypothetical protein